MGSFYTKFNKKLIKIPHHHGGHIPFASLVLRNSYEFVLNSCFYYAIYLSKNNRNFLKFQIIYLKLLYKSMDINYTYKFRLYPTAEQEILLEKHFGCCRFIRNYFLNRRKGQYLLFKFSNNFVGDCEILTQLRVTYPWLAEVGAQCLQQSIRDLDAAYKNFFNKTAKFPQFKNKHDKHAFRIPQNIKLLDNKLFINKFREGIPIVLHREVKENICSCTITKNKAGQYYCSLLVEKEILPLPEINTEIGIDLGIKTLIVDSNGEEYANIRALRNLMRKIKRIQRKLSKRRNKTTNKNSNRIKKLREKLAKLHQKVKDIRRNYIHQTTKKLIDENQVIYVETLAVKNMMKNHKLAGAIADCAWGEIIRQLKYKAAWYGREIVQISRFFPSSKTCSNCGYINQDLELKDREWTCPKCNIYHDRDHNAAKMILKQGRIVRAERPELKLADSGKAQLRLEKSIG